MPKEDTSTDTLASGISEVVNAAFGVGAAVAKTVAQATAPGQSVPPGKPGEGPFADMIHYGVAAASNFTRLITRGLPANVAATEPGATHPRVHAGATLRIPLSIENPSAVAMPDLTFRCAEIRYEGNAAAPLLTASQIEFKPPTLSVAPLDFEKLTVFIQTTEATATGAYVAKITVVEGSFECLLRFEVIPAQ
jgi:hypothetical protein